MNADLKTGVLAFAGASIFSAVLIYGVGYFILAGSRVNGEADVACIHAAGQALLDIVREIKK